LDRIDTCLDRIDTRLDRFDTCVDRIDTRLSNSSVYDPTDTIIPPKSGEVDPPDVFPRTIQALTGLNNVALLSRMEEYYSLSHRGVLKARIRRVLRAYGIGVTITTVLLIKLLHCYCRCFC